MIEPCREREAPLFPDPGVALTQILVVSDVVRSREFWTEVLGAELSREYGGTSVVLRFAGAWLLLVTGGEPTADKPSITLAPPTDPDIVSTSITLRVGDCRGRLTVRGVAPARRPRAGEPRRVWRQLSPRALAGPVPGRCTRRRRP